MAEEMVVLYDGNGDAVGGPPSGPGRSVWSAQRADLLKARGSQPRDWPTGDPDLLPLAAHLIA
ncbi:MAG: hypothetical protein WBG57_03220 [Ornithinimicrobium sp.]